MKSQKLNTTRSKIKSFNEREKPPIKRNDIEM